MSLTTEVLFCASQTSPSSHTATKGHVCTLHWRHNEREGVSNHQPHDYSFKRLFRSKSKKTSKLRVTGLCDGNSPENGEFPAKRASNAKNIFIWWRHHEQWNTFFCISGSTDTSVAEGHTLRMAYDINIVWLLRILRLGRYKIKYSKQVNVDVDQENWVVTNLLKFFIYNFNVYISNCNYIKRSTILENADGITGNSVTHTPDPHFTTILRSWYI